MAGIISSPGIGSGLDIGGIVDALVAVERDPKQARFNQKESILEAQLSAIGSLKSVLDTFQSSLEGLISGDAYSNRSASSADESAVTVSIQSGASPAVSSYQVEVVSLAASHKLVSANIATPDTISGTSFQINGVEITGAASATSLEGLKDAINSADNNPGVGAAIITDQDGNQRLALTATESGAANQFTVTEDFGLSLPSSGEGYTAGADAEIILDGLTSSPIKSSTNTFEGVIEGLDFTVLEEGKTTTLSIATDSDAAKKSVEDFVEAYNNVINELAKSKTVDTEGNNAAALFGDSLLRTLETHFQRTATASYSGTGSSFGSLSEIGITTDYQTGQLTINSSKLDSAIKEDFDSIKQLFGHENGIATTLDAKLEPYLKFDGTLDLREDSINDQIRDIDDQRAALELYVEKFEANLFAKFSAMDTLVASLNQTSSWLTQQLSTLPGLVERK